MIERILTYEFSIFKQRLSLRDFFKNPVFSGSLIMLVGSNLANVVAYAYHLLMGRVLGPSLYSEVAAFIATTGLIGATFSFLSLVIVKFVASVDKKGQTTLFKWLDGYTYKIGLAIAVVVGLLSPMLASFLHIDTKIFFIAAPTMFFSFALLVYRSFLHGLVRFWQVVVLSNTELILRLVLGLLFVYLGFSVGGVIFAMLVASVTVFLLSYLFVKDFRMKKSGGRFTQGKKFAKYSVPILLSSIATSSFFMTDVAMVKHYFSSYDAGLYAAVSTLGRMIYYGTAPVALVMFPLASQRFAKGASTKKVFLTSLFLSLAISLFILLLFYLFPEFAISALFGNAYLPASGLVAFFGVFMVLFSLSSFITNYFLSREKTIVAYIMTVAAALQVFGIYFFHSSLAQVVWVSVVSVSFLLVALLIYFGYEFKNK